MEISAENPAINYVPKHQFVRWRDMALVLASSERASNEWVVTKDEKNPVNVKGDSGSSQVKDFFGGGVYGLEDRRDKRMPKINPYMYSSAYKRSLVWHGGM